MIYLVDEHTLEKLEFDRIRHLLAEQALSALGRDLAMRIHPSRRRLQVEQWLRQTEQFKKWVDGHGLPPFGGVKDVRAQVKRAVPPAKLEPEEFAELASTLHGVDAVRQYFAGIGEEHDLIARLAERIGDLRVIAERIHRVIDPRGKVRDDATDRLYRIRQDIADVRQQTREVFERLLKQPAVKKYLQYPNATFHADRMVLPVKAEQRGRVPGIVHRSSDTGQTLFVEPAEAVELNNRRIGLLQSEQEEINRILWELTHLVHLNQKEILHTIDAAAVVDLLAAKVRLMLRFEMNLPVVDDGHRLKLHRARNPVLMAVFDAKSGAEDSVSTPAGTVAGSPGPVRPAGSTAPAGRREPGRRVVPIDVRLGEDFDVMIITGPNTGGKTAALKTVGLLALMAQSGLPIPAAAGAAMPVFEGIWIDVGDEQSLQQSLSTFSAHLSRILDIAQRAKKQTLVLLDELGAGTDPDEGAAIGRAIVEHLVASGCLAMVTTHLGALKALGYELKRVDNAAVQFDIQTLRPTYELRLGEPGNSNALAIASRLGMPRRLIHAAKLHLNGRERALQTAISGTLQARRNAERARHEAELARQEAARQTLAAIDKAKALEAKYKAFAAWVDRMMKLQAGDVVRVRNFDDPARVVRILHEKQRAAVSIGAMELEVPLSDLRFDVS